jgi:hypothetical protein
MRALRQRRQVIDGAVTEDSRAPNVAGRSSLIVVDPVARPRQAARPRAVPVAAPTPHTHQKIAENVPQNKTNSHSAAFGTSMSK